MGAAHPGAATGTHLEETEGRWEPFSYAPEEQCIRSQGFQPLVWYPHNVSPGRGDVGGVVLGTKCYKSFGGDNIAPAGAGVMVAMEPGVKTPGYGCFAPSELGIGTMV